MLLTHWLENLRRNRQTRTGKALRTRRQDLQLQPLENRVLLAASLLEATPDVGSGFVTAGATEISLTFSEDVQGADQASNYQLSEAGADNVLGTADDTNIVLGASYADSVATLLFSSLAEGRYRLTVSDGITDAATGNALDGDADGNAGGNWVRDFFAEPVTRVGGEFQVNTYTASHQFTSPESPQAVAMDDAGNSVVVWTSGNNQDGSSYGVFGQRYDAAGNALGGEFQVNTQSFSSQRYATVAMDAAGNFLVTWSGFVFDGSGWNVYGQRYDAAGNTLGGEFQVNTYAGDGQLWSTVAMNDGGDFVVTWSSFGQDGSADGVFGKRFDAAGNALGGEFQINTHTSDYQRFSTVAMDSAGNFVVIWSSLHQDGSNWGVFGQRFDANGDALGGEFQINTYSSSNQHYSTVAIDAAGNFVVTWSSLSQDGPGWGVFGQRFDAAGNKLGGEFQINTHTSNSQQYSTVTMNDAGNFLVTWSSNGQDGSSWGVYGQQYDAAGNAVGGEFQINTHVASSQLWSSVVMNNQGDAIVVWSSLNQDGSNYGVFGQRFGGNSAPTAEDAIFEIAENAANGTVVETAPASDPDGDALTYSIIGGDGATAFAIDASTGEISVSDSDQLDYETKTSFTLEVAVSDPSGETATATITINLLNQASLTGVVYVDTNQNGQYEANEMGIDGVVIELLDENGQVVLDEHGQAIQAVTSDGGFYLFEDLDPGNYQVHELQPTGVTDGAEQLGSLGGTIVANDTMQLTLARTDATDYVFAEIGQSVSSGDTATIGFWQNKHGQSLIMQGGTELANWLTTNFNNVFGNVLMGASGEEVASFYKEQLFRQKAKKSAGPAKVDAQFMAVALATYFTSSNLAGDVAADYGFNVTDTGIGTKIVNVADNGAAFNVADGSDLTIMQLLQATDELTDEPDNLLEFAAIYDYDGSGTLSDAELVLRAMANEIYSEINEQGDI